MREDKKLYKINNRSDSGSAGDISRRSFLKILGAGSVAGVVGCADDATQKVLPKLVRDETSITGEPLWYRSTCRECEAGCGITVKTYDGRAVMIEGNKNHPINRGGVCARGVSALQHLYDPDRVRQPLKKSKNGFSPISWDQAYSEIGGLLGDGGKKKAFISRERASTLSNLINLWCEKSGTERVSFGALGYAAEAKAAELVYGVKGVPGYRFDRAEVILNFGADFLETWVSPVEYAKDWAASRRSEHPCRLIQVEPRLSLTGANADSWICAEPGSEVRLALGILKILLQKGRGRALSESVRERLKDLVKNISLEDISRETGVERKRILLAAEYLDKAKSSLVLAGGTGAATKTPLGLLVAAGFLNLVLGNVGTTVNLASPSLADGSLAGISKLIRRMKAGEVDVLFVDDANPAYNLPASFEFEYARKMVGTVVSFASHIDETTALSDYVLPASTTLECWGDYHPRRGVRNMLQPVMKPVFDTKMQGDILIELAAKAGLTISPAEKDFLAFLKGSWSRYQKGIDDNSPFETFWLRCVEGGGHFNASLFKEKVKVKVSGAAYGVGFMAAEFKHDSVSGHGGLKLVPFMSVKSFDGRCANRPWLQELPDPLTQSVWDAWVEIHPDTAKSQGVSHGQPVIVRNFFGEMTVPVYVTPYVAKGLAALPIGHGHKRYGRFAKNVGGNVMELLPPAVSGGVEGLVLTGAKVSVFPSPWGDTLVSVQENDSQMGRDLARTVELPQASEHGGRNSSHSHHGDSEPKQMYEQRPHPLYEWGMVVDLAACTGCSACVTACYAENNIAVVGKKVVSQGREMSWLRIERYHDGNAEELKVSFLPMMCQQCNNAHCETVCPVYATYHNEEGLNVMVYNRCVGTRYCSNNCPYKVRRFNWLETDFPEPLNWQLNPEVTPRVAGVMEKCTFCIQRINKAKDRAKDLGRLVREGDIEPACVSVCPADALVFGDLNDPRSRVNELGGSERAYKVLDEHVNTQPSVVYLENKRLKEV